MARVDSPPWPDRGAMGTLVVREVAGRDGRLLSLVDSFPETFLLTDALAMTYSARHCLHADRERGRCWLTVANGRAEYLFEHDPSFRESRCARLYQEIDWHPAPPEEGC